MSRSLNKVQLIGNLGKDPDIRYTQSGIAVATFSVAMNESWTDDSGTPQERTEWANIVAWKKLAEICHQYLHKGSKVYLEGRMQTRSWDDQATGTKKYITEIVVNNLIMLDGKPQSQPSASPDPAPAQEPPPGGKQEGDLPF